ncbi:MAG: hypothetical protein K0R94_501 [Burkholderiales bacterium]|jgi:hypothetical protein|nr:hypothetical protein [Burkholderiales bacterium]
MPKLLCACLSPESAYSLAQEVDGIITTSKPLGEQKEFIKAFKSGGGKLNTLYLQSIISYAASEEITTNEAWFNWRHAVLGTKLLSEIRLPEDFDSAVEKTPVNQIKDVVRISSEVKQHIEWLREDINLGFEHIYIQSVAHSQEQTLSFYGKHVLPYFT